MAGPEPDVGTLVRSVWQRESAAVVAVLVRMLGDVGTAEEIAQEAIVSALEQWPVHGVPDRPGAWLTTVARRRAVDHLRRTRRLEPLTDDGPATAAPPDGSDVLRLMLLTCHPALNRGEQVAMTLRLVAGLSTAEIGRALLVHEPRVIARIAGAKRTLAAAGLATPDRAGDLRVASVLEVIYLVFNEGYTATSGEDLLRPTLVGEGLRLGRLLADHAPGEREAHGLVALMELQASRSAARTDAGGAPVPLREQDRRLWDAAAVRRGLTALLRARGPGPPGPYTLQAAIAAVHARARHADDTDWGTVVALYDALLAQLPTGVVRLNRAVAVAEHSGPAAGLAALDPLRDDPALRDYHLLPAVRGDLLRRLADAAPATERARHEAEARRELRRSAALTSNGAERAFLLRRADALAAVTVTGPTLGPAVTRFLSGLAPATRRSYRQTLDRIVRDLGADLPLSGLDTDVLAGTLTRTWGRTAPATANRHRAALLSFLAGAGHDELATALRERVGYRRPPPAPPGPAPLIDAGATGLRERALWQLLADSRASITDVLALDVDDLDPARRRAGDLSWGPETAVLLDALVAGRRRGPLFLSARRPAPARTPAPQDLCPETGRRRLSYERAAHLFKAHTGSTLRHLRR